MIKAYYSASYGAETETISMSKLPLIAEGVSREGLAVLVEPKEVDIVGALRRLHSPYYVDSFLSGQGRQATSNGFKWSEQIRDAVIASNAGMLAGARTALEEGVVANIGQGYHHAGWDSGEAYCTFNGLALVAQENPTKRIFVLDCDEHQGDGTAEFVERLNNLWSFSIFGTQMEERRLLSGRANERLVQGWEQYESALWDGLISIANVQPDLVLYQAGVDCYEKDGMSQARLSSEQLGQRDRIVFEFLRDAGIPVLFVMAGGYHQEYAIINHINTFRVAYEVYYGHRKNVNCGTILD